MAGRANVRKISAEMDIGLAGKKMELTRWQGMKAKHQLKAEVAN